MLTLVRDFFIINKSVNDLMAFTLGIGPNKNLT
jgi:hypothetical protein